MLGIRLTLKRIFFSGDWLGDLGQVKVPEILRFPNDDGFLFNHIWGKTLRDGDHNVFGIRRNPQMTISPIRAIEHYLDVARQIKVDLTRGYIFRPTTPDSSIVGDRTYRRSWTMLAGIALTVLCIICNW